MDFNREKPMELEAILPQEICFETSEALDDPKAVIKEPGASCDLATLSLVRTEGCSYYFLLDRSLANCIEAKRYVINLFDGCDYCDCCEVSFKSECKIVHKEAAQANKKGCC